MGTSKQDRQGARTVQDMERKYNFGESFAEVYNIATGARDTAEEAKQTAEEAKANPNLDHESVFNALTDNGTKEGIFRGENGDIYFNASYIMSGEYKATNTGYLPPSLDVYEKVVNYLAGVEEIPEEDLPLYDMDGNGVVDSTDAKILLELANGEVGLGSYPGETVSNIKVSVIPQNPDRAICIEGVNKWGEKLQKYIGTDSVCLQETGSGDMYRRTYITPTSYRLEWLNPPMKDDIAYRTVERMRGYPVFKKYDTATHKVLCKYGAKDWHDPNNITTTSTDWSYSFAGIILYANFVRSGNTVTMTLHTRLTANATAEQGGIFISIPSGFEPNENQVTGETSTTILWGRGSYLSTNIGSLSIADTSHVRLYYDFVTNETPATGWAIGATMIWVTD